MHQAVFNWSGGKDSSLALFHLMQDKTFDVKKLLVSVNSTYNRVSMHGVRQELIEAQADSVGLPVCQLLLQDQPSMDEYDLQMRRILGELKNEGITHSVFGDIFLEDLRSYREQKLNEVGMKAHFPIWKRDTRELVHEFVDLGFKAVLVCVNNQALDESFVGRELDLELLKDLPKEVDPCGENGEYHSFVYDGPIFQKPIPITRGEKVYRTYPSPESTEEEFGFWFCDIMKA